MSISNLILPQLAPGTTPGYPGYVNQLFSKINELATSMGISKLNLVAALGAGSPASDFNTTVAKVNELIDAYNTTLGGGTGGGNTAGAVLNVATSSFSSNAIDEQLSAYARRSALATLLMSVSGTPSITLSLFNNQGSGNSGALIVDGGNPQYIVTNTGSQDITVNLPNTNAHTLQWVEGTQSRPNEQGDVQTGTTLSKVTTATGGTISANAPQKTANALLVLGDSISVAAGASQLLLGWLPVLRGKLDNTWQVASEGYGFRGFYSLTQASDQQVFVNRALTFFSGRSGRKVVAFGLGTNDYGLSYQSASDTAIIAGQLADRLRAANSSIELVIISPVFRSDGGSQNTKNNTLADYTSAILGVSSGRGAYAKAYNASTWIGQSDLSADNIHPNDVGHGKMATHYAAIIAGTEPTIGGPTGTGITTRYASNDASRFSFQGWGGDPPSKFTNDFNSFSGIATFTGTRLVLLAGAGTSYDSMAITVDGNSAGNTQISTAADASFVPVFDTGVLPFGQHRVTVRKFTNNQVFIAVQGADITE